MAEVITEMILPGTYIEVRAEGLLTIGAIATGNVGVLGTAEMGNGGVQILSSFEEGRAKFGDIGTWDEADPAATGGNLTLVRAMRLIFDNGARTVYARRVYDPQAAKPAVYDLGSGIVLRAKTPGTWGNRLQIRIEGIEENQLVSNEEVLPGNGTLALSAQGLLPLETPDASVGSVTVREHGLVKKYQLKQTTPTSEVVQINPDNLRLSFATMPSPAAEVFASYWVARDKLCKVTLRYGNLQEEYQVPSLKYLLQQIQQERNPSQLVEVVENGPPGPLNLLPQPTQGFVPFSQGDNGSVNAGHFQDALEDMVEQNIQLLLVAGLDFSTLKAPLLGHIEKTESLGRERLAMLGANQSKVDKVLENANDVADKRVVLITPGIKQTDPATGRMTALPPYFSAAAIAGKLSSQSPHISLTNKTLAGIEALDTRYNYGQLASLLQNRVLTLQTKQGVRVVKGISSDDGAFKQISIRRIVDYIKEGTRLGCNQYIGKLNNRRVRGNLLTTLDSFLADLIIREFLTSYKLNVFADRAMEIRGEVQVIMDLQPTFSIDYIRVIMNLS
jgi:hypothetical protein